MGARRYDTPAKHPPTETSNGPTFGLQLPVRPVLLAVKETEANVFDASNFFERRLRF